MLCEKNGKQDSATERRIYYPDDTLPFLVIMMPYRILSFRAGARMLCEKNGKQDSATERRIHNSGDVLPSLHHYDALPYPVILNGGKNAL